MSLFCTAAETRSHFSLQWPIYSTQINAKPYYSKALPCPEHGDRWVTLVSRRHMGGSHTAPDGLQTFGLRPSQGWPLKAGTHPPQFHWVFAASLSRGPAVVLPHSLRWVISPAGCPAWSCSILQPRHPTQVIVERVPLQLWPPGCPK